VNPMDLIIGMRSLLIEDGDIPETLTEALESMNRYGIPGKTEEQKDGVDKRVAFWHQGEGPLQGGPGPLLYFVGCTPSFDTRVQKVTQALVLILLQAGVDFGILGNDEPCCGSEVRRMGESGLFAEIVEKNMARFDALHVDRIFTSCPHGFNALKNEYPDRRFEILHATQLVATLLKEGKLPFQREMNKVVVYHDPASSENRMGFSRSRAFS